MMYTLSLIISLWFIANLIQTTLKGILMNE